MTARSLTRLTSAALTILACLALSVPVAAAGPGAERPDAGGSAAKSCKKAKKKSCKKTGGKAKGKEKGKAPAKPDPGPYREGQTCSMDMQAEYAKYGFVCIDISTPGFPLTVLAPL